MSELWDIVDERGRKTGRVHEKGRPMKPGEYHRSATAWLVNGRGEFLISRRRADDRLAPGMWEAPGGSALMGEECIDAAIREVREELGLALTPEEGRLFAAYPWPHSDGMGAAYIEVWAFFREAYGPVEIDQSEVCETRTAGAEEIRRLIEAGEMIPYTYIEELLAFSEAAVKERNGQ